MTTTEEVKAEFGRQVDGGVGRVSLHRLFHCLSACVLRGVTGT
jgi:hypothetical protein